MSFFLNINCSKVLSFILQRSGLKIFPAMLNKHSTGAKDAGMLNTHFAIIAKLGLLLSYPILLRVNVLFNFFLFLEVFFNFVILIEILCRPFLFINALRMVRQNQMMDGGLLAQYLLPHQMVIESPQHLKVFFFG